MIFHELESITTAQKKLQDVLKQLELQNEEVAVTAAYGRILAEDVVSKLNVPGFRRTAMDGYAVRCQDVQSASKETPVTLPMVGEVKMGKAPGFTIGEGQCAYIPTGGMLPAGADGIVIIEDTAQGGEIPDAADGDVKIDMQAAAKPGANLVEIGEDVQQGETVLFRGTRLRASEIGALASLGVATVKVYRPLRLAILSTGDELVGIDEVPHPGQVRDINSYTIMAMAQKYGMQIVQMSLLKDDEALVGRTVREAMLQADLIALSGGSSVGKKDATVRIIETVASPGVFVHGIALKPGKPTILGWDQESSTIFAGVPGHPASAIMSFEMIVMTSIQRWLCPRSAAMAATVPMILGTEAKAKRIRDTCITVRVENGIVTPVNKKSGAITMLSQADGYILIPAGESRRKGDSVDVHLFDR